MPVTKTGTKPFLSLRYKLLIPLMSLGILMFIMGYFGARAYLRETIFNIMDEEVESILDYVDGCLNVDALETFTSNAVPDEISIGRSAAMNDPLYLEQEACIASVRQFNPRAWVYTYYPVDENTMAFGLDMWNVTSPKNGSPLGYTFTSADWDFEQHRLGLQGMYTYDELGLDEETGLYFYGTTSPLVDSKGNLAGGIAVYLDAGWTVEQLQILSNYLLAIFVGIFVLVTVLVLTITQKSMSELGTLQAASRRVAEGDYTPIVVKPQRLDDELSTLAGLFNTMLDKVEEREETLENQVEELKLQIDHEKRAKDVKEIVESQFFKDLKGRAAEVRKQRQQKE